MEEEVTITIVITGKETGKTTVINVPRATYLDISADYELEEFSFSTYKRILPVESPTLKLSLKPLAYDEYGRTHTITKEK